MKAGRSTGIAKVKKKSAADSLVYSTDDINNFLDETFGNW